MDYRAASWVLARGAIDSNCPKPICTLVERIQCSKLNGELSFIALIFWGGGGLPLGLLGPDPLAVVFTIGVASTTGPFARGTSRRLYQLAASTPVLHPSSWTSFWCPTLAFPGACTHGNIQGDRIGSLDPQSPQIWTFFSIEKSTCSPSSCIVQEKLKEDLLALIDPAAQYIRELFSKKIMFN